MHMNNSDLTIKRLKNKVRSLQNDLCQRTRNFLLHRGLKYSINIEKVDQSIQANLYNQNMLSYSSLNHSPSPACESNYDSNKLHSKINISAYSSIQNNQLCETRQKISVILQSLSQQQKIGQQKYQGTSVSEDMSSQQNQPQLFDREKRGLRRQIKRLSARLTFEQKLNQIAKEGLLISEEENYQFRLKITELLKSRQRSHESQIQAEKIHFSNYDVQALKNQIANLQVNLYHQRQLKQQYLQSALQLQDQLSKLTQENIILKQMIAHTNQNKGFQDNINGSTHQMECQEKYDKIDQQIFESIKNTAYSISNCIPITKQSENVNYFRPENDIEVLQALKRAQEYCKQIQKWQMQKIDMVAKQKRIFIDVLNKISEHIDYTTKQNPCLLAHKDIINESLLHDIQRKVIKSLSLLSSAIQRSCHLDIEDSVNMIS